MRKTLYVLLICTSCIFYSCGQKELFMPENKILSNEFKLEDRTQHISIYSKSFNKDTLNLLVNAYVEKYKPENPSILKLKIYDRELPKELIDKIDLGVTADSLGNAQMTTPPKGTKSVICWYWFKTYDKDMGEIQEQK